MTDTEKIIEEIESARRDKFRKTLVEAETLLDKLKVGYSHAEQRIVRYEKWKELKNKLRSRGIDYKADGFLNPAPSDEEILFFRYITDNELMRKSGLWPGEIYDGFNNDTFIFNYYKEYRRVLKKGGRWKELLAAQNNAGGNYRSVTSRILRVVIWVGLIGYIGWAVLSG